MLLIRLLMLPIMWAFLVFWGALMLIGAGLSWVFSGEAYTIRLTIGK